MNRSEALKIVAHGGAISAAGTNNYRVLDAQRRPMGKIRASTFNWLKSVVQKDKLVQVLRKEKGVFVIHKSNVRKLHGGHTIKREYRKFLQSQKTT